jgi:hypothetical protein
MTHCGQNKTFGEASIACNGCAGPGCDASAFVLVVATATTNVIVSFISAGSKGLCGSSKGSGP